MLYKLSLSALGLEAAALLLVLRQSHSLSVLLAFLALHGAASLLIALAIRLLLPRRYAEPRAWVLAFLFSFNFFMPVFGMLCTVLAFVLGIWLPRLGRSHGYASVAQPRFTTHRNHEGTGFRGGQVRSQLANPQAPLDQRLKALVALQDTPAHATGTLLRRLLSDPADDMRLLAYGILDGKEKQIMQRIQDNQRLLDAGGAAGERYAGHKRIAELYAELIYQDLVQGDMLRFACDQVRRHILAAQGHDASDAGLWFMLARLELQAGDVIAAAHALEQAQDSGFARERLLPYIAELRFLQRRYGDVRQLFGELQASSTLPEVAALRGFWGRHGAWDS
ncbi:MAG: hypothetical protein ABWY05_04560 [Noviherbaspirillum sp.]